MVKKQYQNLQAFYERQNFKGQSLNEGLKRALIHKMLTEVDVDFYTMPLDSQNEILSYLLLDDV